jgi:mono/diheme cytochrome c family protein
VRRLVLLLAAVALFAGGCDWSKPGGEEVTPTAQTVVGTVQQEPTIEVPQQFAKGDPEAGKQVFETAGCKGCHTLQAANATGTVGPNLDEAKPELATIVDRVRHGRGAMPAFEGQLSVTEIRDVAAFVFDSTHGSDSG